MRTGVFTVPFPEHSVTKVTNVRTMGRHTIAHGPDEQVDRRRNGVHAVILVAVLAGAGAAVFAVAGVSPAGRGTPAPTPDNVDTAPVGRPQTLVIAVTGKRCDVEVRRADGEVLLAGTLPRGKTVRFQDQWLEVRLGDASAAQVYVNGALRPPMGPSGEPTSFTATRR
jgi:hypothetical protein